MAETKLEIFEPNEAFAAELAAEMREDDVNEIKATSGQTPYCALIRAMAVSDVKWGARIAGRPAGMWGVRAFNLLSGVYIPWTLTGQIVEKYPILFYKTSKDMLNLLHSRYPVFVQAVDVRHKHAIDWVRRLGFYIYGPPIIHGVENRPFVMIISRRKIHV